MIKKTFPLLGLMVLLALSCLIAYSAFGQETQTAPSIADANIAYGFRLQSNMAFYVQIGAMLETADFMAGIGWNNAIWLGGHTYFYNNEELSAFSGIELHILYPEEGTLELHPALPIGFAVTTNELTFILQALIYPTPEFEAVDVLFAMSFLLQL